MKLRNKKTGEIGTLKAGISRPTIIKYEIVDGAYKFVTNFAVEDDEMNRLGEYDSLAELNEEWEDYEEPKEFWFIGEDCCPHRETFEFTKDFVDRLKEIGNYFESEEEAEKAVEKLKAFKSLKDKGFRFTGHSSTADGVHAIEYTFDDDIPIEPLDLLFGGKE